MMMSDLAQKLKYQCGLIGLMSLTARFRSRIPHQAERSCPAGGGSSHTQLSASWQPPPTNHLDER